MACLSYTLAIAKVGQLAASIGALICAAYCAWRWLQVPTFDQQAGQLYAEDEASRL